MTPVGMLSLKGLRGAVEAGDIDTVLVVFTDMYGRFLGKRLDADFFLDGTAQGTHACNYLLTVDMEMDPVPGYRFANWEQGYGDFHLVPDLSTLRRAAWLEKTAMVICDVEDSKSHQLVEQAPRTVLRRQAERLEGLALQALCASELEYYIFRNSYREAERRNYRNLAAAGWYIEDYHALQGAREEDFNGLARRHLKNSGVPIEGSKGEWGPGQQELNLRYSDVVTMADRHSVYKQCLKEVADRSGLSVTFMAKYDAQLAGSSCHIHLSLWQDGKNAFDGPHPVGPVQGSDLFRWFLGGWLAHVPELMVFYAPTVNSYKRYRTGSWAPTGMAWSHDNRTAGFRVVGRGESLRIECRLPGADCNPYLAYAATLASGLDGIERRIEPPPAFAGDAYAARSLPQVPGSLHEAAAAFIRSDFAKRSFSQAVVEHYGHFFRTEEEHYRSAVTDWERRRYFERI